ncbi:MULTISPECIES: PepSY domain-containing protein [Bacillaceae]|uniref:PepSY domain-containing protein n=1 Tax=Bacillaceae TaxID=186817 RepID=UPI00055040F5|nr:MULTISPECIES: PepSY domain-containing protein [Bacillaceae]UOE96532.1 PepSY domain-containing protein [Alkalihalobacillus sp. LMS39]
MKRFVLGVGIGVAAAIYITRKSNSNQIQPEKALKLVKQNLAEKYNISGAWIHMIPEALEKDNLAYTVYRGGITTMTTNDDSIQYEFTVDAKTGDVLELVTN